LLLFNGGVVDFFDEPERFFVARFTAAALQLPLWFDRLTTNGCCDSVGSPRTGCWDSVGLRRAGYRDSRVDHERAILKSIIATHGIKTLSSRSNINDCMMLIV
jgi:hypothetical protein